MNKNSFFCIQSILLFIIVCFFNTTNAQTRSRAPGALPPSTPKAVFADGSFENGMDKWSFWQNSPKLGSYAITDHKPHSGKKCIKLTINNVASEIWHVQLQQRNFQIKKNVIYRLSYWARGENNAGTLEVVFVKGSPPWSYYSGFKSRVTDKWEKYEMLFTAPLTTTDIQLAFQCAHHKGDYFIDDISFVAEDTMALEEMPKNWYQNAEKRIDQIRKGDFCIKAVDKNGNPCKGPISVKLLKHSFDWGTCLAFLGGDHEKKYKETALKHFNCGVFENALKWEEFEREEGKPAFADVDRYIKWSEKNNFPIRGHTLVWGTENYGFDKHWARLKNDSMFTESIKSRITRDLKRYKGKIAEYDVWNEPVHEPSIFNRLGNDILDSAFVWANRADPEAKLYINEYSIISGTDAKPYRDLVEKLMKKNIPLHGIGIQGHFSTRIDPLDIGAKLSYMAQTGLPLKITEFDMDVNALGLSEKEMASEYAKMMRTAFSHPAVTGFLFWGFWDNRHWRPGAGLYDKDFRPKAAADSVYNLIHKVWTTSDTLEPDSTGKIEFRGFFGEYAFTVKDSPKSQKTVKVNFSENSKKEQILNFQ
ncbi:MAG TPA: endo-1,4-beta-xylanase [Chitinispirillaceae bacterium]|nr:endo-1,4-beta-xylanase [Chitinispirillaceae bacterium]